MSLFLKTYSLFRYVVIYLSAFSLKNNKSLIETIFFFMKNLKIYIIFVNSPPFENTNLSNSSKLE